MATQFSLFSQNPEFKQYDLLYKRQRHKRVHYKTPTYKKKYENDVTDDGFIKDDLKTWGRMKEVYILIGNYIIGLNNRELVFNFWNEEYEREIYTYKGKTFKGQHFRVVEAEIKGSEDMRIDKRLKLHEEVLEMLRNNKDLECIKEYCQNEIKNNSLD